MSTTVHFSPATVSAIAHVGAVVTWGNRQWTVHSVEGYMWYAFQESDGTVTVDSAMTPATWIKDDEPVATVIPAGHKIGDGFATELPLGWVRRGVCLAKSYR